MVLGFAIYFFSGSDAYITLGLNKEQGIITNNYVINYVPDVLWAIAFTLSLSFFTKSLMTNALIVISCGLAIEVMQKYGVISGTGDILDVIVEIAGTFIATIIIYLEGKK